MTEQPNHYSRRMAIIGVSTLGLSACATRRNNPTAPHNGQEGLYNATDGSSQGYTENELVHGVSTHLGVTSEAAASMIARLFKDRGHPTAYITGEEGGGAFIGGARYGKGTLWMKNGASRRVYWQGPTVGFDAGIDASKVFTLVYGLSNSDNIYRRFPGVDGSAYLLAGMSVNYQRANGITLAPVRTGIGARLGANVGYTSYTKRRSIIPL